MIYLIIQLIKLLLTKNLLALINESIKKYFIINKVKVNQNISNQYTKLNLTLSTKLIQYFNYEYSKKK